MTQVHQQLTRPLLYIVRLYQGANIMLPLTSNVIKGQTSYCHWHPMLFWPKSEEGLHSLMELYYPPEALASTIQRFIGNLVTEIPVNRPSPTDIPKLQKNRLPDTLPLRRRKGLTMLHVLPLLTQKGQNIRRGKTSTYQKNRPLMCNLSKQQLITDTMTLAW